MKPCIAYVSTGEAPDAWRPCHNPVRRGCVFCRHHEKAIAGIMIGLCAHDYPDPIQEMREQAREQRNSRESLARMPVAGRKPS